MDIQNKIVIIGVVAQSVKDHFYTPLSRGTRLDQQMPGVILHARITNQLIRFGLDENRPIKTAGHAQEAVFIFFWGLTGSTIGFFIRSHWRFSMMICAGLFFLWAVSYAAFVNGWWIPQVPPALAWMLSAGMATAYISSREKRQKALLMELFSKHVSREIADAMWAQRDQFLYKGRPIPQKMTVTILFSDIKGFTTISESLDPEALIQWLNTYMGAMAETIMINGGVVDDYAGDGIKANFGVPFPRKTSAAIAKDAVNAVNCALAMGKKVETLNGIWEKQGLPKAGTRIGIFTGSVVAGALGSSERMKYTTVGDIVNIAARLESYDKDLARNSPWRILIGETTLQYLNNKFNVQMIGEAVLKGKDETIQIYRVFSKEPPV
jgi:adenylate cyclase